MAVCVCRLCESGVCRCESFCVCVSVSEFSDWASGLVSK
jgi:hypothetical protein